MKSEYWYSPVGKSINVAEERYVLYKAGLFVVCKSNVADKQGPVGHTVSSRSY